MQNFMKTILSAVQTWTKGKIKESTADWNQNDPNADNYVKNRTHWEEEKRTTLVNNLTFADYDSGNYPKCNFVPNQKYDVIWNGVLYEGLVCWFNGEYNIIASPDNGYPFYIDDGGNELYIESGDDDNNWVVSIIEGSTVVHKLDSKYLDLPTNLATTDDVQKAMDAANEAQSAANTAQSTADGKMDKNNPVGTGSFSMGRKAGTAVGIYSHAEGYDTTASGENSHAEGEGTKAFGDCSHAEGYNTTASGTSSHAEGGGVKAIGKYSHAEGYSTNAQCKSQHVQGEYNILDTVGSETTRGKYTHIVGNGTFDKRSNAHTLDWNGVGWFQGGLQVGGNAQDDGAKNVLLEGDAVPVPESATVGQTIAVKSVDENGKPVEWECIDATDNGNFGYVVQDTAPEDISVLWVDTADDSDEGLQEVVNIVLAQAKESGVFDGDPGRTPEKGVDYYTEEDKIEMVNAVISALPTWTGGSY